MYSVSSIITVSMIPSPSSPPTVTTSVTVAPRSESSLGKPSKVGSAMAEAVKFSAAEAELLKVVEILAEVSLLGEQKNGKTQNGLKGLGVAVSRRSTEVNHQ